MARIFERVHNPGGGVLNKVLYGEVPPGVPAPESVGPFKSFYRSK